MGEAWIYVLTFATLLLFIILHSPPLALKHIISRNCIVFASLTRSGSHRTAYTAYTSYTQSRYVARRLASRDESHTLSSSREAPGLLLCNGVCLTSRSGEEIETLQTNWRRAVELHAYKPCLGRRAQLVRFRFHLTD